MSLFEDEYEDEEEAETKEILNERSDIVPQADMMLVRDLAKRPLFARVIFFLHKHGVVQQTELYQALGCTQGTIAWNMKRLEESGIVKVIHRGNSEGFVFDRRYTYYKLPENLRHNSRFIAELKKCFKYQCLRAIEHFFSPYDWIYIDKLRKNKEFSEIIKRRGVTFDVALQLMERFGVFHFERSRKDGQVERFKRAFDNFGKRVPKDQTEPPEKPEPSTETSKHEEANEEPEAEPEEKPSEDLSELIEEEEE